MMKTMAPKRGGGCSKAGWGCSNVLRVLRGKGFEGLTGEGFNGGTGEGYNGVRGFWYKVIMARRPGYQSFYRENDHDR